MLFLRSCIRVRISKPRPHRENGYALIAVMILVTVMLISITGALPRIYQDVQREREQEAIFRGEQYARAIYMFHRTVGRYPNSIKELLNTNGTRYLRQAYTDPLSPNGRWHFIHASAAGIILDSQNQTVAPGSQPGGASSAPGTGAQTTGNSSSAFGSSGQPATNTSGFGSSSPTSNSPSGFGSTPQTSGGSSTGFGSSSPMSNSPSGFGSSSPTNNSPSGFGSTPQSGEDFSTGQESTTSGKKKQPPAPPPDCQSSEGGNSSSPAQTGELLGATIVGVAPCGNHASIQILNKKDHYYQWEFLGLNYVPYTLPKTQTVQPSSSFPNAQPGQPQPMGSPANSNPPATQSVSPQPAQNQNPF
jgi:type II secretory pathway pseudopilin PulG